MRDRVTERERYFIAWRYHRDATQAFDSGLELARAWTAAYPRESFAFNSLGWAAWSLGQYQQAIAPLRESMRLDPKFIPPASNLIATLTALNQFDTARKVLSGSRTLGIQHIAIRREAYLLGSQANLPETSALYAAQDAESQAIVGQCADARSEAAAAIRVRMPF